MKKVRKISSCDNDKNHTRTTWKFFVVVTTLQRRTISTALLLGWYGWCDMTLLYQQFCSMLIPRSQLHFEQFCWYCRQPPSYHCSVLDHRALLSHFSSLIGSFQRRIEYTEKSTALLSIWINRTNNQHSTRYYTKAKKVITHICTYRYRPLLEEEESLEVLIEPRSLETKNRRREKNV